MYAPEERPGNVISVAEPIVSVVPELDFWLKLEPQAQTVPLSLSASTKSVPAATIGATNALAASGIMLIFMKPTFGKPSAFSVPSVVILM